MCFLARNNVAQLHISDKGLHTLWLGVYFLSWETFRVNKENKGLEMLLCYPTLTASRE